jgi:hypothetical protein
MTRARLTLLLARFDRGHRLLDELPGCRLAVAPYGQRTAGTGSRTVLVLPATEPGRGGPRLCRSLRRRPSGPSANRRAEPRPAASAAGRPALAAARCARQSGRPKLAASYTPPAGMDCVAARVAAILVRYRSDSEPEYLAPDSLRALGSRPAGTGLRAGADGRHRQWAFHAREFRFAMRKGAGKQLFCLRLKNTSYVLYKTVACISKSRYTGYHWSPLSVPGMFLLRPPGVTIVATALPNFREAKS